MRWKHGVALVALGFAASCGGGNSGGSGTVVAPAPTPSPAPTSTPTPAVTQYQVEGAGPVFAEIRFYPRGVVMSGSNDFSAFTTGGNGEFYYPVVVPVSGALIDYSSYALAAFGVDSASGLPLIQMTAPAGSTVVSPLTTLIYAIGDQALTKRVLQLDGPGFALDDPNRDLRTFSWVRAVHSANAADVVDAHRVRAANIRLRAFLYAVDQFRGGPHYSFFYETTFPPDLSAVAAVLKGDPTIRFYTDAGAEAVLRALPRHASNSSRYRDDVIVAAAHLITLYAAAIGPSVSDDDVAASYMLGLQGYLLRALWELTYANTAEAAERVQAMTVSDIYSAVAPFAEHPALSQNKLFAVPDFFFVAPGGTATIPFYDPGSNGSASLASNDFSWFIHPDGDPMSLVGARVPPRFAGAIAVTQQPGGALLIEAKAGFSGVAWFDYEVRTPAGVAASSRAYVVVK